MPINSFLYPAPTNSNTYEVANSLRFNDDDSAFLQFTPSGDGNKRTFTYSVWFKRANLTGSEQYLMEVNEGANNDDNFRITINSSDGLFIQDTESNTSNLDIRPSRLFRDVSAWYHLVLSVDTTQSTSSNRVKLYINGVQETSFSTETYPSQNYDTNVNVGSEPFAIGKRNSGGSASHYDGYQSEVCFIDGQALDPTLFGKFDEDSGIWKPIDVSGLTFGTNGFYLDFENSGSLGADVSGNGNNFTVNNLTAIDQSTDTCTNNFATLNAIAFDNAGDRLSEGNLRLDGTSASAHSLGIGTIAVNQGKWWFEAEIDAIGGTYPQIGVRSVDVNNTVGSYVGQITGGAGYASHGTIAVDGSNVSTGGTTYTSGDIINVGLDLDDNKIYWYKNGTLMNSGGTTITNRYYTFAVSQYSNTGHWFCNFGAGTIYTISSGNTDGNGYGNFEYAVPSGYYSLNSKNLAEYG